MREGIQSWLYTAWLMGILLAFKDVRSERSSVTVTGVNALHSTSLKVTWNATSSVNETVSNYTVCYQSSPNVNCSNAKRKIVNGSTLSTNLTDLNEDTTYYITVFASYNVSGKGPIGNETSGTTTEDIPAKGPVLSDVIPESSTSLKIVWQELSPDDANGEIINYTVCYKVEESPAQICASNKTVGKVSTSTLQSLEKYTRYEVAVKASTQVGYGQLGNTLSNRTKQDRPVTGANVTNVRPVNSTVLEVSWRKLQKNVTNGNITAYRVCYDEQQSSVENCSTKFKNVTGAENTMVNLTNLNEATTYYVAVKAGTEAGFGPVSNILKSKTLEDVPAKGPVLSDVIPESSTSLKIAWQELSADDANGEIINYTVCYKVERSPAHICASNKTVGKVLTLTLNSLEKYTRYKVAVKASTQVGYGQLGNSLSRRTNQDRPGIPFVNTITADYGNISLFWSKPVKPNGEILNYIVYWRSADAKDNSSSRQPSSPTSYVIRNLKPGITYEISVLAVTGPGEGPATNNETTTLKSGIDKKQLLEDNSVAVSDKKTQIGFKLPNVSGPESAKINKYQVIVKLWTSKDQKETFRNTAQEALKKYEDSKNGANPYIAITNKSYTTGKEIVIGDNRVYSARRKRRSTPQYRNAPLLEDTEYAIFVRVFYGSDTSFSNSDTLIARTEKKPGDDDTDVVLIVLVVVVVIVALLVVIFGVLLLRRRKAHTHYNGIELETKAKPVVRYPIPIAEFRAHCERLAINSGLGYQDEYEGVQPKGPVSAETAKRQENVDKNRYNNIHAYDDSRVVLALLDGVEGSDYINANHIDGYDHKNQFIAAQGALKTTIVDFWRMIWEQNVSSIVMLANPIEKGREKLAVYWPQDRSVKHGPFMIKLDGEVELADYVIRKMTVTQDDVKETRQLTQFHYTVWPDHGVPPYTTSLQAFLTRIRKSVRDDSNPLLVHCSAGVGRTGTFIGIFAMLDMIEATKTVDIFNFVCQMRTQRTHMVQVEAQYVFFHKAVLEAIECGDTEINAPDLRVKMNQLNRVDPENNDQTQMEKQFKVLEKYTFVKTNTEEGKKSFNVAKNRNKEILPYEDTRVSLLKSPGVDGSDYINASSIDSYQVRGMYLATQFPLENTFSDFWRMIWEKKSNCIVMLADIEENPDSFQRYWTDKTNDSMLCGNLLVTLEKEDKSDEFVTRNFKLKKNDGGESRDIWHFNLLTWTEDEVPKTTVGIRQMIGKIQDVQRQGGNNPIVVHCSDGGGRTGAFCALVTSLERVKQDQSFNLFQTIMLQRIQRPRMVTSVSQYKFCFRAILDFLDSFDEYANFQDLKDLRQ